MRSTQIPTKDSQSGSHAFAAAVIIDCKLPLKSFFGHRIGSCLIKGGRRSRTGNNQTQ